MSELHSPIGDLSEDDMRAEIEYKDPQKRAAFIDALIPRLDRGEKSRDLAREKGIPRTTINRWAAARRKELSASVQHSNDAMQIADQTHVTVESILPEVIAPGDVEMEKTADAPNEVDAPSPEEPSVETHDALASMQPPEIDADALAENERRQRVMLSVSLANGLPTPESYEKFCADYIGIQSRRLNIRPDSEAEFAEELRRGIDHFDPARSAKSFYGYMSPVINEAAIRIKDADARIRKLEHRDRIFWPKATGIARSLIAELGNPAFMQWPVTQNELYDFFRGLNIQRIDLSERAFEQEMETKVREFINAKAARLIQRGKETAEKKKTPAVESPRAVEIVEPPRVEHGEETSGVPPAIEELVSHPDPAEIAAAPAIELSPEELERDRRNRVMISVRLQFGDIPAEFEYEDFREDFIQWQSKRERTEPALRGKFAEILRARIDQYQPNRDGKLFAFIAPALQEARHAKLTDEEMRKMNEEEFRYRRQRFISTAFSIGDEAYQQHPNKQSVAWKPVQSEIYHFFHRIVEEHISLSRRDFIEYLRAHVPALVQKILDGEKPEAPAEEPEIELPKINAAHDDRIMEALNMVIFDESQDRSEEEHLFEEARRSRLFEMIQTEERYAHSLDFYSAVLNVTRDYADIELKGAAIKKRLQKVNRMLTEEEMKRCVLNGVAFGVWHFEPMGDIEFADYIEAWVQAQIDAAIECFS